MGVAPTIFQHIRWNAREGVRRRGGKTKRREKDQSTNPTPHVQNHCHSVPNVCTPCVKGSTCLKKGSRVVNGEPTLHMVGRQKRNKEETVPGGQTPQRQGQTTTEPDDRTKRQRRPQAQHTREEAPTHRRQTNQGSRKLSPRSKSNTEAELPPLCVCFAVLPLVVPPEAQCLTALLSERTYRVLSETGARHAESHRAPSVDLARARKGDTLCVQWSEPSNV